MRMQDKHGTVVPMGWDEAQAALRAGTHEVAEGGGQRQIVVADPVQSAPGQQDDDLDEKTKVELEAIAAERGVDISHARTKAEILAALRA